MSLGRKKSHLKFKDLSIKVVNGNKTGISGLKFSVMLVVPIWSNFNREKKTKVKNCYKPTERMWIKYLFRIFFSC